MSSGRKPTSSPSASLTYCGLSRKTGSISATARSIAAASTVVSGVLADLAPARRAGRGGAATGGANFWGFGSGVGNTMSGNGSQRPVSISTMASWLVIFERLTADLSALSLKRTVAKRVYRSSAMVTGWGGFSSACTAAAHVWQWACASRRNRSAFGDRIPRASSALMMAPSRLISFP